MRKITKVLGAFLLFWGISINMNAQKQSGAATGIGAEYFTEERALKAEEIVAGKVIAIKSAHTNGQTKWMDFHGSNNNMNTTFNYDNIFIVEAGNNGGILLRRKSDNKYVGLSGLTDSKSNAQELTVIHPTQNVGTGQAGTDKFKFDNTDTWYPLWENATESTNNTTYVSSYLLRFMKFGSETDNLNASQNLFNTGKGSWTVFYAVNVEDYTYTYPFEFSDAPSQGQFAENTHWYYLKLNEKYATYQEGNNYISLSTSNPNTYSSFWAFVKNDNGTIEIYNAYTGTSKVLASIQPATSNCTQTRPSFVNKNELGDKVAQWDFSNDGQGDYFFLNLTQNGSCVLNDADNKNIMAFWTAKGTGSRLIVETVDIESLIASVKESQKAITGAVGTLVTESYNKFVEALDKNTMEGLVEALKIRDLNGTTIVLDNRKYYRLKNVRRSGYLGLDDTNTNLKCAALDEKNASQLWKITKNSDNTVKLLHANAQQNVDALPEGTGAKPIGLSEEGANYTFKEWSTTQYGFSINGSYLVEIHDNGEMGTWNEGGVGTDHAWYIIPADDIELDISDAGYATVNYPFAIQLPEELTAYTGKPNAEKSKFMLEEISSTVPASTPVVIAGTKGTYTLTIDYDNATEPVIKGLTGVLLPTVISPDDYILAKGPDGTVGFYMTTDGGTLAQNKAYIKSTPTIQGVRGFGFTTENDGDTTTGIESTIAESENEEYYDLQGRRVMNPTKGIYVTKSGKKVLFTK